MIDKTKVIVPALSVRQPWAAAIIHLGKDVENCCWTTSYRGPLLIHAGRWRPTRKELGNFYSMMLDLDLAHANDVVHVLDDLRYGVIIGCVDLVNVTRGGSVPVSLWADHRACNWHLVNPRSIPPVEWRGEPWLFDVELPPSACSFIGPPYGGQA